MEKVTAATRLAVRVKRAGVNDQVSECPGRSSSLLGAGLVTWAWLLYSLYFLSPMEYVKSTFTNR